MEQVNSNPNIQEYETFSEFTREQGSAFKTSIFGFDKEDVISYIDRLIRDITNQKNSLEEAHIRLTDQNRDLVERINRYEQHIFVIRRELEDEKQYNDNAREREELFRKAVGVLQEKVAYLQENNSANNVKELEESFRNQMQRANDIIVRLRQELLGKDDSINRMTEEITRRNDIILNQDRMLSAKDKQVEYYMISLENMKQRFNEQAEVSERLKDQINAMKAQVSSLENRLQETAKEVAGQKASRSVTMRDSDLYRAPAGAYDYSSSNRMNSSDYRYTTTNQAMPVDSYFGDYPKRTEYDSYGKWSQESGRSQQPADRQEEYFRDSYQNTPDRNQRYQSRYDLNTGYQDTKTNDYRYYQPGNVTTVYPDYFADLVNQR